jgi:urate oxidase
MSKRCSVEEYAIELAKHFVQMYPRVGGGAARGGAFALGTWLPQPHGP